MWIGACTSSIGTWMQIIAQGWFIWQNSHSKVYLALDGFFAGIPIPLFSLLGGVVADRIERRRVLLGSQYIQMFSATMLTILVAFGWVHIWQILCLSFLSGTAQAFGGPAYQALIPTLVDKEDMPNAIALNSIQFNVAVMIGPALGGLALDRLGEKWCFGLNALSFLAPVISLTIITTRFLPAKTTETVIESMKQGFRFILRQHAMGALILLAFCMTTLSMSVRTYFPVLADVTFHGGPKTLSMFYTVMGIGSILGSLTIAAVGNARRKGLIALTTLISLGASISFFALSRNLAFSYSMLVVAGASMMAVFASVNSLVQLIVTNDMRGRVMSVYNFAFRGGMPFGNLVTGSLVEAFTVPVVLAVNGVLLVGVALFYLFVERRVAKL